jgi:hypothetical protein
MNFASISMLKVFSLKLKIWAFFLVGELIIIFEEARSEESRGVVNSESMFLMVLVFVNFMFHIDRPLEIFEDYFCLTGDGVFIRIGVIDFYFVCKLSFPTYFPSDPAKSTILSKLSQDFPSLFSDLILI